MLNKLTIAALLIAAVSTAAAAQAVYSPEKGSAERSAILSALRVPVERDLRQPIVFVVERLNVSGNWAFISGTPQTPSGRRPSLKGTKFEGEEDFFDDNFFGLLKKSSGRWRVVIHALGCTDVCYADWWRRYKAPKSIFPYTE